MSAGQSRCPPPQRADAEGDSIRLPVVLLRRGGSRCSGSGCAQQLGGGRSSARRIQAALRCPLRGRRGNRRVQAGRQAPFSCCMPPGDWCHGDEVIVPSLAFIAAVSVIRHAGAAPVFADVDPETYNIDPADIERRSRHAPGGHFRSTRLEAALRHRCRQQDRPPPWPRRSGRCACAFASSIAARPVGSLAGVTVFSLHARKVVTTSEGGMIVTDDRPFADRLRRLRHRGCRCPTIRGTARRRPCSRRLFGNRLQLRPPPTSRRASAWPSSIASNIRSRAVAHVADRGGGGV